MLARILALGGVLVAVFLLSPPGAPGAGKACADGKVRAKVGKQQRCLRVSPGRADAGPGTRSKQVRKVLFKRRLQRALLGRHGQRLVRRGKVSRLVGKVDRALAADVPAAQTAGKRARAAADGRRIQLHADEDKGSTSGGVTTTSKGRFAFDLPECPDAGGELPGTIDFEQRTTIEGPPPPGAHRNLRSVGTLEYGFAGKVLGRVGEDAKLSTYDLTGTFRLAGRFRVLGPGGVEHRGSEPGTSATVRLRLTGLRADGRGFGGEAIKSLAVDVRSSGGDGTVGQAAAQTALATAQLMKLFADGGLEAAQRVFFDRAECLAVTFDPAALQLNRTDPTQVRATVADRDGARVALPLDATATGASVTPPRAPTTEDAPAEFTLTAAPEGTAVSLEVTGTSKRGRARGTASGTVSDSQVFAYEVRIDGDGTYAEEEGVKDSEGGPYADQTYATAFDFSTGWPLVIIPLDGQPAGSPSRVSASEHEMTGTTRNTGVFHGDPPSSFECIGTLAGGLAPANNRIDIATAPDGSVTLALNPFYAFGGATGSCSREGAFYSSAQPRPAGPGSNDVRDGAGLVLTLSRAELDRPVVTVPLTGRPLAGRCNGTEENRPPSYCRNSWAWRATMTLTKRFVCQRQGSGYACIRPA